MRTHVNYLMIFIINCIGLNQINAQSSEYLNINNVKARINVNAFLFNDPVSGLPSYEYPINSGENTIFSANLILIGQDVNGQMKGMVPQINNNADLYAGPIMDPQHYATSAQIWDRVWKINCSTIQLFKDWYSAGLYDALNGTTTQTTNFPGYQIPSSILDWPAHGDVSKGQLWNIAPYFDNDGDNFYAPSAGDYPLIKGDQAIFFVYNDERPSTWAIPSSRSEVRVMAYAFATSQDSALSSTVFLNYEIINRSTFTLFDARVGFAADLDVGNYSDDFLGSDVARSSFYGYNGDSFDEDNAGVSGYGSNLAAQSIVLLNGPKDNDGIDNPFTMTIQDVLDSNGTPYECLGQGYGDGIVDNETSGLGYFMQYGGGSGPQSAPITGLDYYKYLGGKWLDNSSLVYGGNGHFSGGGTIPTKHMFPATSDPLFYSTSGVSASPTNWSEITEGNPPGDRKGMGSFDSFTLQPGSIVHLDIALVTGVDYTGSGNMASVAVMNEKVDSIRSKFCNGLVSTCETGNVLTSINSVIEDDLTLEVFPNPFNNDLTINYKLLNNSATLSIYNLVGKQIKTQTITQNHTVIDLSKQPNGIYFITITDRTNRVSKKIVKQ